MIWRSSICSVTFLLLFFLSMISLGLGIFFSLNNIVYFVEWQVVCLNSSSIVMTLLFDWMSLLFMGFVLFISSMVIFYSGGYMEGDLNVVRFILLVVFFVLSMMLLVISPNLISILLGWDGLGLISYLLVIYYQNFKSYSAGMLTVMSNRLGDVAFLLAIAWMLNFGSWNYIFYVDLAISVFEVKIISFLMIFAAMTKSAQIPFSSWLPAAMAAPTPVSALVHSSTLVTAGIYLMIRFNSLILYTQMSSYLLFVGGLTMFMSGLGANFEFDLKKIIALSTLSQLGLMMSVLSMGYYELAFFHLLTHALFKALLFMCAGVVIHNMGDCQDIRLMGGLVMYLPLTSACFCVSNLALCGIPFLAGFYSKDLILEMSSFSLLNLISFYFYFFSTGLTASYTFRLIYFSMFREACFGPSVSIVDEGWLMLKGMVGMVWMSVLGGAMISWIIFPIPAMICLPFSLKVLALLVTFIGGSVGLIFSFSSYSMNVLSLHFFILSFFSGSMWFMPYISTRGVSNLPLLSGSYLLRGFDHGWNEYFGGQGVSRAFHFLSIFSQLFHFNLIKTYLMGFMLTFFFIFLLFY